VADDQGDVDVQLVPYCGDRRPGLPSLLCELAPGHEGMHRGTFDGPAAERSQYGRGEYLWAPAAMVAANGGRGTDRHPGWLAGAVDAALHDRPGPLDDLVDVDDVDELLPALVELTDDDLRAAFADLSRVQRLKLIRTLLDVVDDDLGRQP
jgi:hypothetical protein